MHAQIQLCLVIYIILSKEHLWVERTSLEIELRSNMHIGGFLIGYSIFQNFSGCVGVS